jgi:hypothetical protein
VSPPHSVAGALSGHTTSHDEALPHASVQAPWHVALHVLTSAQLPLLPGPSVSWQSLALVHEALELAPAVMAQVLTSVHEAAQPLPQVCSHVETAPQLVSQASPHDRSQVFELSHDVSQPDAGQSTVQPFPPEHPQALPTQAQPLPTHAGAGAVLQPGPASASSTSARASHGAPVPACLGRASSSGSRDIMRRGYHAGPRSLARRPARCVPTSPRAVVLTAPRAAPRRSTPSCRPPC